MRLAAAANPAKLRTLEKEAQREGKFLKRKLQRQQEREQEREALGRNDRPIKREDRSFDSSRDRLEPQLQIDSRGQSRHPVSIVLMPCSC